jgi:hypothetical protein
MGGLVARAFVNRVIAAADGAPRCASSSPCHAVGRRAAASAASTGRRWWRRPGDMAHENPGCGLLDPALPTLDLLFGYAGGSARSRDANDGTVTIMSQQAARAVARSRCGFKGATPRSQASTSRRSEPGRRRRWAKGRRQATGSVARPGCRRSPRIRRAAGPLLLRRTSRRWSPPGRGAVDVWRRRVSVGGRFVTSRRRKQHGMPAPKRLRRVVSRVARHDRPTVSSTRRSIDVGPDRLDERVIRAPTGPA